jgi:ribonuclease VapC
LNIFVDASAWVAIIIKEADAFELEKVFGAAPRRYYSAMSLWEAARAISRLRDVPVTVAALEVRRFIVDFDMMPVPIGEDEARLAVEAHARYGKGTGHPARLNMGDCFAYACAKTNDARLLYKGDDFSQTDLA